MPDGWVERLQGLKQWERWVGVVSAGVVGMILHLAWGLGVSALGIEEQRVNVVIALDSLPAGSGVGDGFRVEAALVITVAPEALLVPTAALVRSGTRWAVMRMEAGRARRVEVDVRERSSELAWIDQPLLPGEWVVLYPGTQIRDGQRIAVR